jgi:polysaccharide pyruvyl transferase WcaK-like protein
MLYCLKTFFQGNEFLVATDWNDARLKISELNKCDYILIGGGGLLLRNISKQLDLIRCFRKPFGLIGVSVEAKHRSMTPFLDAVKEKADFILVRDKQSKLCFDNHYKVIVGPDLTFLVA